MAGRGHGGGPVSRRPHGGRRGHDAVGRPVTRRRGHDAVGRPVTRRRRRGDPHRGRQHGKDKGRAVVGRGYISCGTDADAACVDAARTCVHAAGNVRPVGVVGAAGERENKRGGKKSELHGKSPWHGRTTNRNAHRPSVREGSSYVFTISLSGEKTSFVFFPEGGVIFPGRRRYLSAATASRMRHTPQIAVDVG